VQVIPTASREEGTLRQNRQDTRTDVRGKRAEKMQGAEEKRRETGL
jgi:hypothetical protein